MKILGISAYYHDSASAIIDDGKIVAAAQEERFTRVKHDPRFPRNAIAYCLQEAGTMVDELDYVAFYDKPLLKFERLVGTYLANAPRGFSSFSIAMPVWLRDKLFQKRTIVKELSAIAGQPFASDRLLFSEHHQSHAASAFYPSPFHEAAVLTVDGVGEWATSSLAVGSGNQLDMMDEIRFPHSLGLFYSAFTYYLGFKVNSGEYKLMGLAPYGEPKYRQLIVDNLIDILPDGSFRLNLDYFDYCVGLKMTNSKFDALFGAPPRAADQRLEQKHMDIAASIQAVTEDILVSMAKAAAKKTGQKNLCLAGGVALNCVANSRLLREGIFEKIWVQPAAGDAGGAVGAALAAYHDHAGQERRLNDGRDSMRGSYLGPGFSDESCRQQLTDAGAVFDLLTDNEMIDTVALALAQGQAIGWFQGRMEYGPRALGNRSILGDPRSPTMQKNLNLKIKFRESFRPFAPSCLAEEAGDWFEFDGESPYMLFVADVKKTRRREMTLEEEKLFGVDKLNVARSEIPAVTHVDYSARLQTVSRETNPLFHALLTRFNKLTGCPLLVNTSFNVRGEPIVATPEDAFRCFMGTELDMLAVGRCVLRKSNQDTSLQQDYKNAFELD